MYMCRKVNKAFLLPLSVVLTVIIWIGSVCIESGFSLEADQFPCLKNLKTRPLSTTTSEELEKECFPKMSKKFGLFDRSANSPKDFCGDQYSPEFIANSSVREMGLAMGVQAAAQSAADTATGFLLKQQADKLAEMKKYFANVTGSPVPSPLPEEILVEECKYRPDSPRCKNRSKYGSDSFGFGGDEIVVNPNNAGTYVEGMAGSDGSDTQGVAAAGRGGDADPSKMGATTSGALGIGGGKGDGSFESTVAAAQVKSKAVGGGGGGGGGVPSMSAPGGGGGDGAGNKPPNTSGGGSSTLGYAKSGGGGIGFQGGGGRGNGGKEGSENPFDKLFGKKDAVGQGETLNFRDLASQGKIGDASTDIFQRISNRYKNVWGQKRIIIYDEVPAQ